MLIILYNKECLEVLLNQKKGTRRRHCQRDGIAAANVSCARLQQIENRTETGISR